MKDKQVLERFNIFQNETGKYRNLNFTSVEFSPVRLKELVKMPIRAGGTPATNTASFWSDDFSSIDNENFFGWRNIEKEVFEKGEVSEYSKVITKSGFESSSTWLVPENSILIAIASASKGLVAINKKPMCTNQNILGVVPKDGIDVKFIYLNLRQIYSNLDNKDGYGNLSKTSEENQEISIPKDLNEDYPSLRIQQAIVDFIEYYQERNSRGLDIIKNVAGMIDKLEKIVVPLFFNDEKSIETRFNQFSPIVKYHEIDFEMKKLGDDDVAKFPTLTRTTGIDIKPEEYLQLSEDERSSFIAHVSGTVENNQVAGYISKGKLTNSQISSPKVVSWSRISPSQFFIQEKPVCTNDDSFVMEPTSNSSYKYLQLVATMEMSKHDYGWTKKAGKTVVQGIEIPVPKPLRDFTSLELQILIVDFWETHFLKVESMKDAIQSLETLFQEHTQALIQKIFKGAN